MRRWMDCIGLLVSAGSSGSYWLDRIGISLGFYRINWILCAGWFDTYWIERMYWMRYWWYRGGMEGPTLVGAGMGAPLLAPERERHHWLLRGGSHWEAAACTNCVIAARARTICVGSERNKNRLHTNRN